MSHSNDKRWRVPHIKINISKPYKIEIQTDRKAACDRIIE